MTRINTRSTGFSALPPRAGSLRPGVAQSADQAPLETVLFGSVRPKALELAAFPHLAELMRVLTRLKGRVASFVGDRDDEYSLVLSEGAGACVDKEGRIFLGEKLLQAGRDDPSLLVGVLAHEIGHRPKTWKRLRFGQGLSRADLTALARDEEAKADRVAGRVLAELGLAPDGLCNYLRRHGHFEKQPETYYPVNVRVEMIREAHEAQAERLREAKRLFPDFHRATNLKHLIHDGRNPDPAPARKRRTIKGTF